MEIINLEGVTYLPADIFGWGPVDIDPDVTKTIKASCNICSVTCNDLVVPCVAIFGVRV